MAFLDTEKSGVKITLSKLVALVLGVWFISSKIDNRFAEIKAMISDNSQCTAVIKESVTDIRKDVTALQAWKENILFFYPDHKFSLNGKQHTTAN